MSNSQENMDVDNPWFLKIASEESGKCRHQGQQEYRDFEDTLAGLEYDIMLRFGITVVTKILSLTKQFAKLY